MKTTKSVLPLNRIQNRIFVIRDARVMLSPDLADLYGVQTKVLNQAVQRNRERFPSDFMFQLSPSEVTNLKSQIVTSSWGGARRSRPYAFTEHGILMLSSVLRSSRAVKINIEIMRAFITLRALVVSNTDLAQKLAELEMKYDDQFSVVFKALRQLLKPAPSKSKRIGF